MSGGQNGAAKKAIGWCRWVEQGTGVHKICFNGRGPSRGRAESRMTE